MHAAVANGFSQDFVCEVDLISRAKNNTPHTLGSIFCIVGDLCTDPQRFVCLLFNHTVFTLSRVWSYSYSYSNIRFSNS